MPLHAPVTGNRGGGGSRGHGGGGSTRFDAIGLELFVVCEKDGHGGKEDIGNVSPHLVHQDTESGNYNLHLRLQQKSGFQLIHLATQLIPSLDFLFENVSLN